MNNRDISIPYQEIVGYLNKCVGSNFRHWDKNTRDLIRDRWSEGFRTEHFRTVIENQTISWSRNYNKNKLIPGFLFGKKFNSYLTG